MKGRYFGIFLAGVMLLAAALACNLPSNPQPPVPSLIPSAGDADTGSADHAYIWQRGTVTDLGTLGGLASQANGMNDRSLFGQAPDRDPLHPNEQGYQVMAGIWFGVLTHVAPNGGRSLALRPKGAGKAQTAPPVPKR